MRDERQRLISYTLFILTKYFLLCYRSSEHKQILLALKKQTLKKNKCRPTSLFYLIIIIKNKTKTQSSCSAYWSYLIWPVCYLALSRINASTGESIGESMNSQTEVLIILEKKEEKSHPHPLFHTGTQGIPKAVCTVCCLLWHVSTEAIGCETLFIIRDPE